MKKLVASTFIAFVLAVSAAQAQRYKLTDLGALGGSFSEAQGINASGQVVGWFYAAKPGSPQHAFLYSGGVMTDLGAGGAFGINDSAAVTGGLDLAPYEEEPFLYSNETRRHV